MKITLPTSIKDITLGQFQDFNVLVEQLKAEEITDVQFVERKISLFSGIPIEQIDNVLRSDLEEISIQIDTALNQDSEFQNMFVLKGIEFGFVDNLNDIQPNSQFGFEDVTSGEYFDMTVYGTEVETLHKLMAVLFRPIKKRDKFGNYKVEKYKGSAKYSELMKEMPLNIVNGSIVFFCNLSTELEKHILKSTVEEQARENKRVSISSNGDGTVPSMN